MTFFSSFLLPNKTCYTAICWVIERNLYMKGTIKSVLKEELRNSVRMKKRYEDALRKLPKGSLQVRVISGHRYYYIVKRIGKKVKYLYKGKISVHEKQNFMEAMKFREKYRKLLSQVKKQITFLKGTLRGKEAI